MSPHARCPECGKKRLFHPDEMKGVKKGKILCTECMLDESYYVFLGEVLNGEHPELKEAMLARLQEEDDDE